MLVFVSGLYTTHDFGRKRDLTRFSKSVDAETGMDSSHGGGLGLTVHQEG